MCIQYLLAGVTQEVVHGAKQEAEVNAKVRKSAASLSQCFVVSTIEELTKAAGDVGTA